MHSTRKYRRVSAIKRKNSSSKVGTGATIKNVGELVSTYWKNVPRSEAATPARPMTLAERMELRTARIKGN